MKNEPKNGILAGALLLNTTVTCAEAPITAETAHAIAVEAYHYIYSLVTMDITRKQSPVSRRRIGCVFAAIEYYCVK